MLNYFGPRHLEACTYIRLHARDTHWAIWWLFVAVLLPNSGFAYHKRMPLLHLQIIFCRPWQRQRSAAGARHPHHTCSLISSRRRPGGSWLRLRLPVRLCCWRLNSRRRGSGAQRGGCGLLSGKQQLFICKQLCACACGVTCIFPQQLPRQWVHISIPCRGGLAAWARHGSASRVLLMHLIKSTAASRVDIGY